MNRCIFSLLLSCLFCSGANAQLTRFVIGFRDKGGTSFTTGNPSAYLTERALARRARYGLSIDSSDLPVSAVYLQQLRAIPNVSVLNVSNWLNAVSIQCSDDNSMNQVRALAFVGSVRGIASRSLVNDGASGKLKWATEGSTAPWPAGSTARAQDEPFDYGTASFNEIHVHKGEFLHNAGMRGQTMMISVLDGGFFHYTTLPAFDSVNANGQVISTWDFVANEASVVEDNNHGMQCFSTIAANIPGQFIGTAPKALFNLFRTEDVATEFPIEEFNWACAAQRADSMGTDLISSSLGYGYGWSGGIADYPYSDLNGDITISARTADMAAAKGILVVNSAGNSGNDYWKMIVTPADADSVLAVGAVSVAGVPGSFSSYGPSADGRVKPDVAGVGVSGLIQNTAGGVSGGNGTSYSAPKMAGLAACLWQAFPEMNNMRIIRALRESGSRFATPDDRVGYGVPDLKLAFGTLLKEYASFTLTQDGCTILISGITKATAAMRLELDRQAATDTTFLRVASFNNTPFGSALASQTVNWQVPMNKESPGAIRYRIMQVTDTAASGFTRIQLGEDFLVDNQGCFTAGTAPVVLIAPNPTDGNLMVVFTSPTAIGRYTLSLFDLQGHRLLSTHGSKPAGPYRVPFDLTAVASGKYLLQVLDGTKKIATISLLKR